MATTIRKAVITEWSQIKVQDSTISPPAKNEVQIKIAYAGFSGADANMLRGTYPLQKSPPLTPGYCFVGRVAVNGPESRKFVIGDLVTALTVYGSDAERINISENDLVAVPEGLPLDQVVALTLDWNTAYPMVEYHARVQPGQRVFVHGLSGAVGNALLVLCKLRGAQVYGTASPKHHEELRAAGAIPFTYTDRAWVADMQKMGGVDAVFDALGYESFDDSYSILSSTGICIGYGFNLGVLNGKTPRSPFPSLIKMLAQNLKIWSGKRTSLFRIAWQRTFKEDLETLLGLLQKGEIAVQIKGVWDLEDIGEAHRAWGSAPGMGSLVIRVEQGS